MKKSPKVDYEEGGLVERRRRSFDRRESDRILKMIAEGTPIPTFAINGRHKIIYWNRAMEALSNLSAREVMSTEVTPWKMSYNDKRPCLADLLVLGKTKEIEEIYRGRWKKSTLLECAYEVTDLFPVLGIWMRCTASLLRTSAGGVFGAVETLEDVTDRVHTEEALRKSESLLASVLQGSPIPTFVIGPDHRIIHWNRALEELSGIEAKEVLGTRNQWKAFYDHERPCMADIIIDGRIDELSLWYGNDYNRSTLIEDAFEGTSFFPALGEKGKWIRFTSAILRDQKGNTLGALETLEDITTRILAEEALKTSEKKYKTLSITDSLTKLFNSRHFYHRLRAEMDRSIRYGHALSLLFFDIDDFKAYNDAYGHLEGDRVLARLAGVILRCLRKTDSAYRLGGEEFTAILPETEGIAAKEIADRIRLEFARERFYPQEGEEKSVTVSIGIAQFDFSESLTEFIRRADMNMYEAKTLGKNRIFFK